MYAPSDEAAMAGHRIPGRRHWPAWFAAGAVVLGLCGIVVNPLFQAHGPIGANRSADPLAVPSWPRLTYSPSPVTSPSPASPAPSAPEPTDRPVTPVKTGNLLTGAGADHVAGGTGDPTAAIAGWTILEGGPAVVRYGTDGYPGRTSPGPADRGTNFFDGGTVARSRLAQTVTLPGTGAATFNLSGLLGGFEGQEDAVTCTVTFVDADGRALSSASLGPVTAEDRHGVTGLFQRTATGPVPPGARTAQVELLFTRAEGTANDGYADSLLFAVTAANGS